MPLRGRDPGSSPAAAHPVAGPRADGIAKRQRRQASGRMRKRPPERCRRKADGYVPVGSRPVASRRPNCIDAPPSPGAWPGAGCTGLEVRCGDTAASSKERCATCWCESNFRFVEVLVGYLGPALNRRGMWRTADEAPACRGHLVQATDRTRRSRPVEERRDVNRWRQDRIRSSPGVPRR